MYLYIYTLNCWYRRAKKCSFHYKKKVVVFINVWFVNVWFAYILFYNITLFGQLWDKSDFSSIMVYHSVDTRCLPCRTTADTSDTAQNNDKIPFFPDLGVSFFFSATHYDIKLLSQPRSSIRGIPRILAGSGVLLNK